MRIGGARPEQWLIGMGLDPDPTGYWRLSGKFYTENSIKVLKCNFFQQLCALLCRIALVLLLSQTSGDPTRLRWDPQVFENRNARPTSRIDRFRDRLGAITRLFTIWHCNNDILTTFGLRYHRNWEDLSQSNQKNA